MTRMKFTRQPAPNLLRVEPFHQKLAIELSLKIMRRWALSDCEQFALTGLEDTYTFGLWQQRVFTELSEETYLRLANIIDVNRQLKLFAATPQSAARWLKAGNPAFQGHSPVHHMLSFGLNGMQDVGRLLCCQAHRRPTTTSVH